LAEKGISLSFGVFVAAAALGLLTSRLRIDALRLVLLLVAMSLLALPQVVRNIPFSVPSLLLLMVAHAPYVLHCTPTANATERTREFFLTLCACLGALACAQFLLQFVMAPELLFPIENFAPKRFVVQLFNQQAPLAYGSTIYRANGVFMIEPSLLSQLLAIGLVLELYGKVHLLRLALFGFGILFTYSGTGFMILAVCVPVLIAVLRRWKTLGVLAGAVALLVLLRDQLFLNVLLDRSAEFTATGSSGFARFVGGFWLFDQFLWHDPLRTLIGFGAGAFTDYVPYARAPVSEMPLFKMTFEFGVLGAILHLAFLGYCVFATAAPLPLRLAVFIALLLNGLSNPFAHGLAFGLLVWATPARASASPRSGAVV
jgi:hypothetical protein